MTSFAIRGYRPSDLEALYEICLKTGDAGEDATGTIDDRLLGHYFAAPYAVLDPDLAFVATSKDRACGYIVGTADSMEFEQVARKRWFAPLAQKYARPPEADKSREAALIRLIHDGYRAPHLASTYPAHLHINLLPVAQGLGLGARLMTTFLDALSARDVAGVHLGVDRRNARALAFYPRLGFEVVEDRQPSAVMFGMTL